MRGYSNIKKYFTHTKNFHSVSYCSYPDTNPVLLNIMDIPKNKICGTTQTSFKDLNILCSYIALKASIEQSNLGISLHYDFSP